MKTPKEVLALLSAQPRQTLGFYPTPLQKLERISAETHVELYAKREDFSGMTLFGGNKIRKLEYLMGDAKAKGCDVVVTYGATQSNHAMQTATAARKCGLTPVLFLVAIVEPKPADLRANLLLDTILGAELHILTQLPGESMDDTLDRCRPQIDAVLDGLRQSGRKVYDLPSGGTTPVGMLGYVHAYAELTEQLHALGREADYLFVSTGTGGTLAGLIAGKALIGSSPDLVGVQVSPKVTEAYAEEILALSNQTLRHLGQPETAERSLFRLENGYYHPGYEIPSPKANDDIRYLARTEGLFTDPVYSGKGFHAMMEHIRRGLVPPNSTVVFIHTGGATALFSEAEIVGDLTEK